MSVHRYFIVAVGLIILIDIVAFGDDNQVTAQVAQPAKYHRDHKLVDLTSSPGGDFKKPGRRRQVGNRTRVKTKAKSGAVRRRRPRWHLKAARYRVLTCPPPICKTPFV